HPDLDVALATDTPGLTAERVLIDGDHLWRGEDRTRRVTHRANVVSRHERRREDRPEGEVRAVLGVSHPAVPHLEHVRIVPVTRPGELRQRLLPVEDVDDTVPAVGDVVRSPPEMSDAPAPLP